jgi:sugar/nucleoside kinase (ribokinase family)
LSPPERGPAADAGTGSAGTGGAGTGGTGPSGAGPSGAGTGGAWTGGAWTGGTGPSGAAGGAGAGGTGGAAGGTAGASGAAAGALDLLVIGDCNPDVMVVGGDVTPAFGQQEKLVDGISLEIGGSASITAVAAARLGLKVALAAAVGDDPAGRFMLAQLAAAGVDTNSVAVRPDAPTGMTVALSAGGDRAILTATGAVATLTARDVPSALLVRARHVHVSSYFLVAESLGPGLAALLAVARAAGASTSLDTNWDPAQRWADPWLAEALGETSLLLPNEAEALYLAAGLPLAAGLRLAGAPGPGAGLDPTAAPDLTGAPDEVGVRGLADAPDEAGVRGLADAPDEAGLAGVPGLDRAVATLTAAGPRLVVKLGERGALCADGSRRYLAEPPPVTVADATGAGDCFNAGVIAGLLGGLDLPAAVALGCAVGTASTRAPGGTAGCPDLATAQALARDVTVREVTAREP